MEKQTKKYIKDIEKQLNEKFEEFNENLRNYFFKLTNKYSKAFGLDEENIAQEKSKVLQRDTKKYLDKLIKIKNLHEQILENIKVEMSILINSLDISNSLEDHNPIGKFLEKEFNNIVNSWLYIKLEFEKFNLTKTISNSNLDEHLKNSIYKISQNKNIIMNISPAKKKQENPNVDYQEIQKQDLTIISEKCNNITKIKINQIKNADIPFKLNSERQNFQKLKSLEFNNCSFSDKKEDKYALIGKCTALEKLIFNGVYNFEAKMLMNFPKNLTKLILSNNNFVNSDFKNIMDNYIIKSESLRNSLEFLSFSNNSLSNIIMEYGNKRFHALKELDFHRNKITKFVIDYDTFYKLKCINCCYNRFSKTDFERNNKVVVLLSGNIFLTGLNKYKNYYSKLEKQLNNYNDISLTHLTISYIPFEFGKEYFERIKINNSILINLKNLNLSHNNLNCDVLFNFILNNMGCINLKVLNLCGNKLDDTFFEKFFDNNYQIIFNKLQKINLVDNLIGDETKIDTDNLGEKPKNKNREQDIYKLRLIYKFIENNKNLSKLYLNKNPMCDKSIISTDLDIDEVFKLIEKDNQNKIIIDSFYSFLKKIKDELLMNPEEKINRGQFNIKFDIDIHNNLNSENFNYEGEYIMFK